MGIGREVADAYISVHGDLSKFRRDLGKAGPMTEKAAKENADSFADAWGKRIQKDMNGKWGSILDAMYSDKQVDWDRMFGEFDPNSLKEARNKVKEFLNDMRQTQHQIGQDDDGNPIFEGMKLNVEEAAKMLSRMDGVIAGMNKREQEREGHARNLLGLQQELSQWQEREARAQKVRNEAEIEAHKDNEAWMERRRKTMQDAIDLNNTWARTLDGLRKNSAIKDMEGDFRKLAETMDSADMAKFAKNFDSLHQARSRIYDVTAAMEQQGRMSREQSEKMQKDINDYIDRVNAEVRAEKNAADEKSRLTKMALDETKRLREAQDKYNASLNGMARNFHFSKLENDFRNLAAAMDSNNWDHFANGALDVEHMRRNIANTAGEMHRLGRMTDTEYGLILERVHDVNHAFDDGNKKIDFFRNSITRVRTVFSSLNKVTRGFREHLQGFAGLNVFGDMIREGLDFVHNLDRIAVSAGKLTLILGSLASIGGSALGGLAVIAQDLGASIGGLAALFPAFATGAGLMAFVTISALGSLKEKFKETFKQIKKDMGEAMFTAMDPAMDRFNKVLLPTLKNGLKGLAKSMGLLYGSIFDGIVDSVSPADMALMFGRLDKAVEKSRVGVKHFVNAWAVLGKTGTKYFDRFAVWFNKLGTSFDAFITKAEKDGSIDKWIETGIKGFKDLGRTIDGTLGVFNAIADAARRAGSGGLSSFADKMQAMAKAMQEQGFQDTLTMMFSGMNIAVSKIGAAIRDLGPAMQSVMPSVKLALVNIGDAAATLIGYIGGILSNPLVQKGITDFTGGIKTALEILKPAMEPFGNSIGNALTLLGKVGESVAKIATAFTVELAPVLDDMSIKVQGLLTPLSDMAQNVIRRLKPVAEAINTYIVGPVIASMKSDLIPAFNGFVDKAGPVLEKIVKDLGPVLDNLFKVVLPGTVKIATELLSPLQAVFDLFTPGLADLLERTGKGFDSIAAGMRLVKGEARPEDWGVFTQGFSHESFDRDVDETQKKMDQLAHPATISWKEIWDKALVGDLPFALSAATSKVVEAVGQGLGWLGEHIADGWNKTMKFLGDQLGDFGKIFTGDNAKLNALSDEVDKWIKGQLDNLGKGNQELSKWVTDNLDSWWGGIKGMFQDWMKNTFGIGKDTALGDNPAGISGGGGAGGKGTGVMGKITDEMLGNTSDPKPLIQQWFTDVTTSIGEGFAQIGANIAQFGTDIATNWNGFWGGFGTVVSDTWTNITTWVSTNAAQIGANIAQFGTDVSTNWNNFWTGVNTKVTEVWNAVTTWIGTKAAEIGKNISDFITTTRTNWDNFWGGVRNKVTEIWNAVTGWISIKVGEIRGSIDRFIGGVRTNWDNFWNGVKTKVDTIWSDMRSAVERKAGEVIDFVRTMPQKITGQFSNMWAEMERIGGSIWQGLKQGIDNGIQWVSDAARNLARNAVAAAQLALDINSPSKVFRKLGLSTGEGFVQGIDRSGDSVISASRDMAALAIGEFAHSKMFIAGKDAASGLASGLLANKSTVAAAYSGLGAIGAGAVQLGKVNVTSAGGDDRSSGQAGKTFAAGAVQVSVTTQATNPDLVASKVTDSLDDAFARFSGL